MRVYLKIMLKKNYVDDRFFSESNKEKFCQIMHTIIWDDPKGAFEKI